jgi:VWFA-related protein
VHAIAIEPFSMDGRQEPDPDGLHQIAGTTGGSFYVVHEDQRIPDAAARVLRDLREQYVVGFEPAYGEDNRFHAVNVTVTGRDCRVVARDGYYAPRRTTPR